MNNIAVPQVFHYANDMDTFAPVMNTFKRYYDAYPKYAVADAGYGSFNNYIFCEENNIKKYMKFSMYNKITKDEKYRTNPYKVENFKIETVKCTVQTIENLFTNTTVVLKNTSMEESMMYTNVRHARIVRTNHNVTKQKAIDILSQTKNLTNITQKN